MPVPGSAAGPLCHLAMWFRQGCQGRNTQGPAMRTTRPSARRRLVTPLLFCALALCTAPRPSRSAPEPAAPPVLASAPRPAAEAPKHMTVPEGFHVTLFAGEPDVVQPIAFGTDDRGRLWVAECLSYPNWDQTGALTGPDRI